MTTPVQLFLMAVGIVVALHSVSKGLTIGSLPFGWFIAEDAEPEHSIYIWLGACLVFGFALVFQLRMYDARHNKTSHR